MKRILIIVFALLTLGVVTALPAGAASGGSNWCIGNSNDCANAWSGGPWVKDYTGGPTANGDFLVTTANGVQYIDFTGPGSWNGRCMGAANNDPGDERVSLDSCPGAFGGNPSGDGWGTHWHSTSAPCGAGYAAFQNLNSGGWLGPTDLTTNGAQYYRNNSVQYCFKSR